MKLYLKDDFSISSRSKTPLSRARIFRDQYFLRFPICRLHLIILGHIGYFFAWIGIVYGWDWCHSTLHILGSSNGSVFNTLFQTHKKSGDKHGRLPKYLYYLAPKPNNQKRREISRISTLRLNGTELMSLFKLLCIQPIFEYVASTRTISYHHRQFEPNGQNLILALLKLVTVTTNVRSIPKESQQDLIWETVQCYTKSFIRMFKDAKAKDKEYLNRDFNGFNLKIPNLSALYSIPKHIQFIGDLDFSDTACVCLPREI